MAIHGRSVAAVAASVLLHAVKQELLVELRKGRQPLATAKKLLQLPYAPAKAQGGSRKWN